MTINIDGFSTDSLPDHDYMKHYELKKGDIYVEVGAYIGRSAKIASEKDCGKVILIEPDSRSANILQQGIDSGLLKNTIIIRKAVGNNTRKGKFIEWTNSSASRLAIVNDNNDISDNNDQPEKCIDIEVDTIDNILDSLGIDHVDLLCSDSENAEINLVLGAQKYLKEALIKNVAIATYHSEGNHEKVTEVLKRYGFKDIVQEEGTTYGHFDTDIYRL